MTKDEAVPFLNTKGFNAKEVNGVIMIESAERSDYDKMRRLLKKEKYNASYGWKYVTNGDDSSA